MTRPLAPFAALALVACASSVSPATPDAAPTDVDLVDDAPAPDDAATTCTWQWSPTSPMRGLGGISVRHVHVARGVTWLFGGLIGSATDRELPGRVAVAQVVEGGSIRRATREVAQVDGTTGLWTIGATVAEGDAMGLVLTSPRQCRLLVLDARGEVQRDVVIDTVGACRGLQYDAGRWSLHGEATQGAERALTRVTVSADDLVRRVDLVTLGANDRAFADFVGPSSVVVVRRGVGALGAAIEVSLHDATGARSGTVRRVVGESIEAVTDARAVVTERGPRVVMWAGGTERPDVALWSVALDGVSATTSRRFPTLAERWRRVAVGDMVSVQVAGADGDQTSAVLRPDTLDTVFERTHGTAVLRNAVTPGALHAAGAGFVGLHGSNASQSFDPYVSWLRCR